MVQGPHKNTIQQLLKKRDREAEFDNRSITYFFGAAAHFLRQKSPFSVRVFPRRGQLISALPGAV